MKYCKTCGLEVGGDRESCPLCACILTGSAEESENKFPEIKPPHYKMSFLIKIISFICIVVAAVSLTVNFLVPSEVFWAWFVCLGIACLWVSSYVAIMERKNILQNITWQLNIISALAIIWDFITGWHTWSLEYVFPSLCVASMLGMLLYSRIARVPTREIIIYFIISAFYGILPMLLIIFNVVEVIFPAAICVCVSLVAVVGLIIFEGKTMKNEILRKFHL